MRKIYIWIVIVLMALPVAISSCVDEIAFGNSFLEKAPGGDVTEDTVFNSAEYTRQFLTSMYTWQYYGIPWQSAGSFPYGQNYWMGSISYLTDCYQVFWSNSGLYKAWYTGLLESSHGMDRNPVHFIDNNVWYTVRAGWKLMDNIGNVPGIGEAEKKEMVAQAKCLMAAGYYQLFRHYGGLPIIRQAFKGTEDSYNVPRATVEETVKFIVELLDEAVVDLPWGYDPSNTTSGNYDNAENDMGRWTRAGAMALKCKVLLFAASPLFNNNEPYAGGSTEAEQQHLVWYGSYKPELWDECYNACKAFFDELQSKGYYHMEVTSAANPTVGQYRIAYRSAYFQRDSKEILHSTRVTSTYFPGNYLNNAGRFGLPTYEYMLKFPWSDGRPFDWEETKNTGKSGEIFVKWANAGITGDYNANSATLTRDPRIYETIRLNGVPRSLSNDGTMSNTPYEIWVSGYDAGTTQETQSGQWGTGFSNNKYYADATYSSTPAHWPTLRLSDLILTYAEAKLQAKNDYTGAIELIDQVRARVGLKGLIECHPDKNLLSNKNALLDLLLNERACELGVEDSRFLDMTRYKLKDAFTGTLHVLKTYRLDNGGNVIKERWYGTHQEAKMPFPSDFKYEIVPITSGARRWWEPDYFEPKWYLLPISRSEMTKGYLIQNPGW